MLEEYKDFFMAMLAILGIFIPPLVSIITEKIKNPQISYRVPIILLISVCSLLCFVAFYIFFTDIIEMLFEKISKFILTANNLFGLPPNLTNFFMQLFIASSIFMFGAQIFSERLGDTIRLQRLNLPCNFNTLLVHFDCINQRVDNH